MAVRARVDCVLVYDCIYEAVLSRAGLRTLLLRRSALLSSGLRGAGVSLSPLAFVLLEQPERVLGAADTLGLLFEHVL